MSPRFGTHSLEVDMHACMCHHPIALVGSPMSPKKKKVLFLDSELFLEERKSRNKGYAL